MTLRQTIERQMPRPAPSDDAAAMLAAVGRFRDAIRDARATAAQGDLLNLDVGVMIRSRINRTLKRTRLNRADLADEEGDTQVEISVNDEFPWGWQAQMPAVLIAALPHLPGALEYRLLGTSLVLVDVDGDVVIDVLPDAFPLRTPGTLMEL
jgi:hypothetical protein